MTIILGTFIVLLVLFMVLAMAMAEWADQDAGDLLARWLPFRRAKSAAAPTSMTAAAPAPAAAPDSVLKKSPAVKAKRAVQAKKSAAVKAKSSVSQRKRK